MDHRLDQIINGTAGHHAALDAVVRDAPDGNVEPLLADTPHAAPARAGRVAERDRANFPRASHVRT